MAGLRARILSALLIGVVCLVTPACRDEGDRTSRSPTASEGNPRLAVLSPALTIMLADLGLDDLVVGRHGFDLVLDASTPVVGNELGLDYEALVKVEPTHVLLESNERGVPPRLAELAERRGWAIVTVSIDESLDDIMEGVVALDALAPEGRGGRAIGVLEEADRAWSRREVVADRLGTALLLIGTDLPGVLGPGSFHFDLVGRLGGEPVPREGAMYIRLSVEDVIRLAPDSLVLFMPGAEGSVDELLGPLSDVGLGAVEAGRVVVVRHPHCLTPSTSLIEAADEIAAGVAAWPEP